MKVLMIEPLGFSGIAYYTASLCSSLNPLVDDLTLLTTDNYELGSEPVPYRVLPYMRGMNRTQPRAQRAVSALQNPWIVSRVIHRLRPTLVHFQDSFIPFIDQLSVCLAGRQANRVFYTVHDVERATLLFDSRNLFGRLMRLSLRSMYRRADRLIVHSQNSIDEMQQHFTIDSSRISQIPLGVQSMHMMSGTCDSTTARSALNLPHGHVVLLFFGNLKWAKGLDLLLSALKHVVERFPDILLLVAGPPREENKTDYLQIARELGVLDHVRFDIRYLHRHEVPQYFIASDIVVLPYRKVYQSAVWATACAFGVPVIASRVGGLAEVVEDGRNGYLVDDPCDVKALADKILLMATHPDRRYEMGRYMKALAETKFSWKTIARQTFNAYRQVSGAVGA